MGFVENVNKVANGLSPEFTQSLENAVAIAQMTVSVHDLPEGSSATADWDNTTSVMDLGIPAGATGATGLTGATGTGIQSIDKTSTVGDVDTYTITFTDLSTTTFDVTNGKDGVDGVDGLSAYQIALSNGFVGTEAQWLESLKGIQGETGIQGPQGIQGETGLQGPQGIQGATGAQGVSLVILGQVADVASLPDASLLSLDQAYIVQETGDLWFVDEANNWANAGRIVGPQGDAGPQGIQGVQGQQGATGADGISAYQVALNNGFVGTEAQWIASLKGDKGDQGLQGDKGDKGDKGADGISDSTFSKPFIGAPLFSKASAASLSIPIGTSVKVGASVITVTGAVYTLSLNSVGVGALDIGTKAAGTDYSVYALEAGGFIISASKTNPTGYTTANSKRIGGFHYGVIHETFTAINNITSSDATKIAGINQYSFWDLKFRPICDPSGMVYVFGRWYDIYLLNTDHHLYGTSAAGKTIAGGAVTNGRNYPKIPSFYGGDGSVTYGTFTWFEAAEIAKAHSKDLISYNEFVAIAYGVLEASSASTADTGITQHLANYTSNFGICMATGCQWIWGKDLIGAASAAWSTNTEGRGSIYNASPIAALFGGGRDNTSYSGSRASSWDNYVWGSSWSIGCRFACDHLELA